MPRPAGRFTFDAELKRFRNAGGQLIPDNVVLPTAVGLTVSADDALEMLHVVTEQQMQNGRMQDVQVEHVAGASTPSWLQQMKHGLRQPCMGCGQMVGLGDVTLSGEHSRDWGKHR